MNYTVTYGKGKRRKIAMLKGRLLRTKSKKRAKIIAQRYKGKNPRIVKMKW